MFLSIIIPTFNESKVIEKNLNKIISYFSEKIDFEIIVVDDGSTDNTLEIISELNKKKLIVLNNTSNLGKGAALKIGIEKSKGDYIAFMDDDDRWLKEKIKLQLDILKKCEKKKTMVYCYKRGSKGNIISRKHNKRSRRGLMLSHIFKGFLIPSSSEETITLSMWFDLIASHIV